MPDIVISDTSCFCFISVNVWNEKFWKWPENSAHEGGYIVSIQLLAEPQGAQACVSINSFRLPLAGLFLPY